MAVELTVTCEMGHVVGTWWDTIAEKYPFHCGRCEDEYGDGDLRTGKHPWLLTARTVESSN